TRFSGYIAIDELYDGPFCVLSLVDNRAFIRLSFRVLEHDPTQNDIRRFLADFKARLDVRGLAVRGVTTDGSELYPEPLKELWPDVPHQVCEFHVIKEITKAVLHALVATRKKLRDRIPKHPHGRASPVPQGHPATTAGEQVVRTSIPVRSTSADRGSEDNLAADHARVGTLAPLAADHGGGLPIVRPPLPDGDGAGSTGSATGTREPVQAAGPGSGQAFQPELGEGADVPG